MMSSCGRASYRITNNNACANQLTTPRTRSPSPSPQPTDGGCGSGGSPLCISTGCRAPGMNRQLLPWLPPPPLLLAAPAPASGSVTCGRTPPIQALCPARAATTSRAATAPTSACSWSAREPICRTMGAVQGVPYKGVRRTVQWCKWA